VTRRLDFEALPWDAPAEGVRSKAVSRDGRHVRLVEFAPGFLDPEWCRKGHAGYVLEGRLELAFADGAEAFSPGDALVIPAGDAHRARVVEGPVRLFLVEEAEPGAAPGRAGR
jgi:quercetin dioxygenase-like cupin family protein